MFLLFLLLPCIAAERSYPAVLTERELKIPDEEPVKVFVDISILETEMDFSSEMLTIFGNLRLAWRDSRKSWEIPNEKLAKAFAEDVFSVEATQELSLFRNVLNAMWKPGIYNDLHYYTFKEGSRFTKDRISVDSSGNIRLDARFAMQISCNVISNNYPFDQYSCWFNLADFNTNKTVSYNKEQMIHLLPDAKHEGHEVLSIFSEIQPLVNLNKDNFLSDPEWISAINFKVDVKRSSARLAVTVLTPVLVISLLDALFFIFSSCLLSKCALIPAYCVLFDDIAQINTIYDWPPMVRFFFSRLVSTTILCFCYFTALIATKKSDQPTKTTVTPTPDQLTKFQKIRNFSRTFLFNTRNRLIALIVLNVVFYIIFSIDWSFFRSERRFLILPIDY